MYFACFFMCVCVCLVLVMFWRRFQIAWDWSFGCLWAIMWVLGAEPRSFASETSALNYWGFSPANEVTIDKTELQIILKETTESQEE